VPRPEAELRALKYTQRLGAFLDRLDDHLPLLESRADETFWPALARILLRGQDWAQGPDSGGSLARDAARSLARMREQMNPTRRPEQASHVSRQAALDVSQDTRSRTIDNR